MIRTRIETGFRIAAGASTTKGRVREYNEDAFLCDVENGLFVVADGMGGQMAGGTASRAVVEVFPLMLDEMLKFGGCPDLEQVLARTLRELSGQLRRRSGYLPVLSGLGTTASVLFIAGTAGHLAWAGDSPIYLFRDETLAKISRDQTTAEALLRAGYINPGEVAVHPLRNALEEYIGKKDELNPGTSSVDLRAGDRFLICSDGLNKGLSDDQTKELLKRIKDPAEASKVLTDTANGADGSDNITTIVVSVEEGDK